MNLHSSSRDLRLVAHFAQASDSVADSLSKARLQHNTRLRHIYLYAKLKPALKTRSHISSKIRVSQPFYTRLVLDSS
ncbi:hypothetical protein HBI81_243500 [Parastagonospora nodorum]|nr:hypothetical protein HBI18_247870 [Parastagonospora nodorum]KAH6511563.1 hypothetical protein HBI81_243500 [Parastagonospora nodorum]